MNFPWGKLQNKRVLVTGSNGFLGEPLSYQLRLFCKEIHLYNNDIREISGFRKGYDIVFHLAALNKLPVGGDSGLMLDVNTAGTLAVMQYCRRNGAKCVFASSSAVYEPLKDKHRLKESSRLKPVSLYGISKKMAEDYCKAYARKYGFPVIALRIFNMYGQGQDEAFLIPYLARQLFRRRRVSLEAPQAVRDFIYIDDVIEAFILAGNFKHSGFLALNVGTGIGVSVYNIAKKISSFLGAKEKIVLKADDGSLGDYVIADTRNICNLLNWKPRVAITQGLKLTIAR